MTTSPAVIPEIFYRESKFLLFLFVFLLFQGAIKGRRPLIVDRDIQVIV